MKKYEVTNGFNGIENRFYDKYIGAVFAISADVDKKRKQYNNMSLNLQEVIKGINYDVYIYTYTNGYNEVYVIKKQQIAH